VKQARTSNTGAAAPSLHGRVVARFGKRYIVAPALLPDAAPGTQAVPGECDAIGRGRNQQIVVGDLVLCALERELLVIEHVCQRRNLLLRADADRTQPLAANVDQIAIIFAAQPTPQTEFVWRALVAAAVAGIDAVAILNKSDLPDSAAVLQNAGVVRLGARLLRVSARSDPAGTRLALEQQCSERVTLFVGQSGMGKSTLLNLLIDKDLRTGALSRSGTHGRQTTTVTRWFSYGRQGALIDSPGFHEFGLEHLSGTQLTRWMPDFAAVREPCRFADCRHAEEPGCAIRAAVASGAIEGRRYDFYRKILAQDPGSTVRSQRT